MRWLGAGVLAALVSLSSYSVAFAQRTSGRDGLGADQNLDEGLRVSLTGKPGDAARGRAVVTNRQVGLCLLCHSGPFPDERFQGNLAPDLKGTGSRWSEAEIRLRIVDASKINPDTIMPPYFRTTGLTRVAPALQGKTVLTAEQIEDVVAFLTTLKD